MNKSCRFNLLFDLTSVLVSGLRSAQGISNKEVFAFYILEFDIISHDCT